MSSKSGEADGKKVPTSGDDKDALIEKLKKELADKDKRVLTKLQSFDSLKAVNEALHTQINQANSSLEKSESMKMVLERKNKTLEGRISQLMREVEKANKQMISQKEVGDTLRLKDEKIAQILKEGEALSRRQMKMETSIKKLKGSNKVLSDELKSTTTKLEKAQKDLGTKVDDVKRMQVTSSSTTESLGKMKSQLEEKEKGEIELRNKLAEREAELRLTRTSNDKLKTMLENVNSESAFSLVKEKQKLEIQMVENSKREVERLSKDVANYERLLVDKEQTNADLWDQISKLHAEKEQLENNSNKQIAIWQEEFDTAGNDNDSRGHNIIETTRPLIHEIEVLSKNLEEKVKESDTYRSQLEDLRASHRIRISALQKRIEEKEQELGDSRHRLLETVKETSDVRAENDTYISLVATQKNRISYLEESVAKYEKSIAELKREHLKAESVLKEQLYEQIRMNDSVTKQIEQGEDERRRLNKRDTNNQKELEELRKEVTKTQKRRTDVEGDANSIWKSINSFVGSAEGQSLSYRVELEELTDANTRFAEKVSSLEAELEKKTEELRRIPELESEIEELERKCELALELVGEREEQYEEVNEDIDDIKMAFKSQILELLSKIEVLEGELKDTRG